MEDRMTILALSYGHVADHMFESVDGATDPTN